MTRAQSKYLVGGIILSISTTACFLSSVEGERAATGDCPAGEVCSEATPEGLIFVGTGFWDDEELRLGPLIKGGKMQIGLRAQGLAELGDFTVEAGDGTALSWSYGTGVFGPTTEEGQPYYSVDAYIDVRALQPGATTIRIVEPQTGELFDRLTLDVFEIEGVTVVPVSDPDRPHLVAGESELVGVRLLAGDTLLRAIDQDVQLVADGEVQPENMYWDCFTYETPTDMEEVRFTVLTGEASHEIVMPILTE